MKKYIPLILSAVLLSTSVACNQANDKTNQVSTSTNGNNSAVTKNTKDGAVQRVVVPTGTTFNTDLQEQISTGKNRNNDRFTLRIKNGSIGKYATLKDAQIQGHLENVFKAARGKKAKLNLVFDQITLKNGDSYPLDVTLVNTQVETKTKGKFLQNTGIILGGVAAGKFLGDKAKVKHGALAGGAAATAFVLSSPGGEVVLKKGTDIKLKLKNPLETSR
jgi:hypothetical protein